MRVRAWAKGGVGLAEISCPVCGGSLESLFEGLLDRPLQDLNLKCPHCGVTIDASDLAKVRETLNRFQESVKQAQRRQDRIQGRRR